MATRLYFGEPADNTWIRPSFDGGWTVTTNAQRRKLYQFKDGSTIASTTSANTGGAAIRNILIAQYVGSQPLQAQTISGTIKAQIRGNMSNTSSRSGAATMIIKVMSQDGTTSRGTIYSSLGTGFGANFTTTLTNRRLASTSITSVVAQDGDYLMIEIGWTYKTGTNTATSGTLSFGSSSGTDLPEDETTTAANNAWIEFSHDFLYKTNRGIMM